MIVVGWPGAAFGRALSANLACTYADLDVHRFPDGESRVRIDCDVRGSDVVMAAGLDRPDTRALPVLFAADALRELGARHVCLAAPYLAYMRQDARFAPGEAISSRSFARILSAFFDSLVTVEPHLHRWAGLDAIYSIPSRAVAAAGPIAEWVCANVESPIIVGPDAESEPWVAEVARLARAPHTVMAKRRAGDHEVGVQLRDTALPPGLSPVIVDDIVSTGNTIAAATRALREGGCAAPVVVGVHALFDDAALARMAQAGARRVVTCDTIDDPTNAIPLAPAVARAVREFIPT